jgi:hypothetical protein
MQRKPGTSSTGAGWGVLSGEELLDRVVEPPDGEPPLGRHGRRRLVDRRLRLEDGVDVASRASLSERQRDRRAADHVHVADDAASVQVLAERRERGDDFIPVHGSAAVEGAT